MNKKYLFLDFDGVLHSYNWGATQFELLPLLYNEIISYKESLNIVISSSWKTTHSLSSLKNYFPQDMQDMIVGITPDLIDCRTNEGRYREILLYMKQNNLDIEELKWIAIDDEPRLFPDYCPNLIRTLRHEGISQKEISQIKYFLNND